MAIGLALVAGMCYAAASVIEHSVARQQRPELAMRLQLILALVRRPLWVAGFLVGAAAYCMEAAALALGNVMTVAPLLVSGLLFALPLSNRGSGRRMTASEWSAAVVLTVSLAVFVTVGAPRGDSSDSTGGRWLVAVAGVTVIAGGLTVSAATSLQARRALRLGVATGVVYGLTAVLTKTTADLVGQGVTSVATHWQPYALMVASGVALLLNQSAFQAGHLAASLPAISVVNPVTASLLGAALFGEHLTARGPAALIVTAAAAVVMMAATVTLARSPLVT